METGSNLTGLRNAYLPAAVAVTLAAATVVVRGPGVDAICWAAVQIALVALAAEDIRSRRIPNVVTGPTAAAAVGVRVAFERSEVVEILLAGAGAFAVFLAVAVIARGGLGMGDVKLAGLLGLLLGTAVVPALFLATLAGAIASAAIITRRRERGATIAYGPYLCFGGAVAVLALHLPRLV